MVLTTIANWPKLGMLMNREISCLCRLKAEGSKLSELS